MVSETQPSTAVRIAIGFESLIGDLVVPEAVIGVVLFAHGSGSGRLSPRNRAVAQALHHHQLATLLVDLLTPEDEKIDRTTGHLRFDIPMLASRVVAAIDWLRKQPATATIPIGLFGASTGGAAALVAAAARASEVAAVVSRGGRPDLAGPALPQVQAPTLLIVGGDDRPVIVLNREAESQMTQATVRTEIIPGASHLFEEPGTLEQVAEMAGEWFVSHFRPEPIAILTE
jgi:dienelactone hydrolase